MDVKAQFPDTTIRRKSLLQRLCRPTSKSMPQPVLHSSSNVLSFLQDVCPPQVVPKILAYAGPQQAQMLYQTNQYFHILLTKESTWKVLCEELYKVRIVLVLRYCVLLACYGIYLVFFDCLLDGLCNLLQILSSPLALLSLQKHKSPKKKQPQKGMDDDDECVLSNRCYR